MTHKIVDMAGRPRPQPAPVPDFWFAQVDLRLLQIEAMVMRLERLIWIVVTGGAGLLVLEIIKILAGDAR